MDRLSAEFCGPDGHSFRTKLIIESDGSEYLEWYLSPNDGRYRGTLHRIPATDLGRFISALDAAWSRYIDFRVEAADRELTLIERIGGFEFELSTKKYLDGLVPFADQPYALFTLRMSIENRDLAHTHGGASGTDLRNGFTEFREVLERARTTLPRLRELANGV